MNETLIVILPGITIYAVVFIVTRFILSQLWKMSHVYARFFQDSAEGRTLSREAGYHPRISAGDEPCTHARLTRSITLVTWFRYLSAGTALVFVAGTAAIIVGSPVVAERYRILVFVASAVHVLPAAISYVLVRRNERLVTTAIECPKLSQEKE